MKVLHLLDSVDRGGAEMIALDVCRNAGKFGIELTIVATSSGDLEKEFRKSGAEFIRLERRFPVDPGLVGRLRRIIREKNIRVVQSYQPVAGLHLYLATKRLDTKNVISFQGFLSKTRDRLAAKFLIPRMDANIFVSRGFEKWFKREFRLKDLPSAHLIYNCSDSERLRPTGKSIKEEMGLNEDATLLGMIANFPPEPRKDQITVCHALPAVFAVKDNTHFLFAGQIAPGGEKKFNKCVEICRQNGIADRVHFLGGRSDIPDLLAALDVFVFSSLHEGLPVAVIEAMLAGVPTVLSDIEPLLEVSGDGRYAEVFPVGDAQILSEKISKLLNNENLRKDLAARAKRYAEENFSIEAHMRALIKLYQSL